MCGTGPSRWRDSRWCPLSSPLTGGPAVCFKVSRGGFTLVYAPDVLSIPDRENFLKAVDLYIGDGSSLTRDIIRKKDDKLIGHASMLGQLRWAEG